MAFWSGEKILANQGVIVPFNEKRVDVNAYKLAMGDSYFVTADEDSKGDQKTETLKSGETFIMPAGQFAYLLTAETIKVPANAMALISMRTAVKFKGLINVSGFHVDPGYDGRLAYAVFNAGPLPIQLKEGEELFKIWFADLDQTSAKLFDGAPVNSISGDMVHGMGQEVYSLQTLAHKIRDLEYVVDKKLAPVNLELASQKPTIDTLQLVWRTVTLAVVGAIVVAILAPFWPQIQKVVGDIVHLIPGAS